MINYKTLFLMIKNLLIYGLILNPGPWYRIVEINLTTQKVIFIIKGKAALLIKKFSEAVADNDIINGLSPMEACWLGGYYGIALLESIPLVNESAKLSY